MNGGPNTEYNQDHTIVYVWTARSQPRDLETGEIAFDISYDSKKSDWSRVPIRALMDLSDNTFAHEDIAFAVNDWIDVAKKYPYNNRKCLCCSMRAIKGKVLCSSCNMKYGATVYA